MARVEQADVGEASAPDKEYTYWRKEIERSEKHFSTFWKKADKLYKTFAKQGEQESGKRQFALLWANTEVLKPSVYARPPVPQVSRRYKDKDPVGRLAAELLERSASYEFERMNIDACLRAVRDDLLLPGRGQAWVRYEAEIDEQNQQVKQHRVICDYLHYRQFLHSPARKWDEVWWVGKVAYLTDEQGKQRFGEGWKGVELDNKSDSSTSDSGDKNPALVNAQEARATVYEIWSKKHKKVIFVPKAGTQLLAVEDPLLEFENFFPCPRPVYSTLTNNSLIPTPDYKYYQDQAEEVDALTDRIDKMTDSLKLVGFYPAGAEGDVSEAIAKALSPDTQNAMIPVASWAAFGERGGGNSIVWLPIKDVVEVIRACIELRNQVIQDTYQITGISDILRGATDSNETATAQSIKAQWGSVRIRDRQEEMARFARDLTRMMVEVIAEEFDPEYILTMANMPRPEQPQMPQMQPPPQTGDPQQDQMAMQQAQQMQQQAQQAMQAWQAENSKFDEAFAIMKDDRMRGFRIDIETDSTIQPDEDAEKQRRTEFVTAIGSLMQQAAPLLAQAPELLPLIKETLLFTARGFRAGRGLEDEIEKAMDSLQQRMQQAQSGQQKDPNAAINEAKAKQMQAETDHKTQLWDIERQFKQQMNALDLRHKQDLHAATLAQSQQRAEAEHQAMHQKAQVQHGIMQEKGSLQNQQAKDKMKDGALQKIIEDAMSGYQPPPGV